MTVIAKYFYRLGLEGPSAKLTQGYKHAINQKAKM